ncbi:MAG: putative molybdenum carrier protein [Nostoc sp.]|uniref:putative molybdenum carrier protein n=1 Tax=Nostoc sp. TaxID=1180 RepID=UPI002FF96C37
MSGGIVLALLIVGGLMQGKAMPTAVNYALLIATQSEKGESILSHQRLWVVTGGQTGVDRAALDTALSLLLPVRGWCPKGRLAEDGKIPPVYPLQETTSTDYALRTEWNVRDSDGTLVLAYGSLEGGTKLTADLAHKYDRPVLIINALSFSGNDAARFWSWIQKHNIRILNVAGPRESSRPGVIYNRARYVLKQLLES